MTRRNFLIFLIFFTLIFLYSILFSSFIAVPEILGINLNSFIENLEKYTLIDIFVAIIILIAISVLLGLIITLILLYIDWSMDKWSKSQTYDPAWLGYVIKSTEKQLHIHIQDFEDKNDINSIIIELDNIIYKYIVKKSSSEVGSFQSASNRLVAKEIIYPLEQFLTVNKNQIKSGITIQGKLDFENMKLDYNFK